MLLHVSLGRSVTGMRWADLQLINSEPETRFRIVTDNSGVGPRSVMFPRNPRSRCPGMTGHVRPETSVTLVRNTSLGQSQALVVYTCYKGLEPSNRIALMNKRASTTELAFDPAEWLPSHVGDLSDHQTALPRIAKDPKLIAAIESRLSEIPTRHELYLRDSRNIDFLQPNSVHLVVTSPPYWTLKDYREHPDQMGCIADYDKFLSELDKVWRTCFNALVPGGRLVCVVGDVCLSRRKNKGEHTVVPLHASIQEHCRTLGFSNVAPIIWHKIANAAYEASGNGGGFLGKPYEPNAVIKNDIEFILMQRKPGGYRSPSVAIRVLSVIPADRHKVWFQQIWTGVTGASTKAHPAPYPIELAERLVRMFSFVGDTVLDPFMGTGTTNLAAAQWGRNSIGVEVDPHYLEMAHSRLNAETPGLFASWTIRVQKNKERNARAGR